MALPSGLTETQRRRLSEATARLTTRYADLVMRQAMEASSADLQEATDAFLREQRRFEEVRGMRGLEPGDQVRLITAGPYEGHEGVVTGRFYSSFLSVSWPDDSPCCEGGLVTPTAGEVELVEDTTVSSEEQE